MPDSTRLVSKAEAARHFGVSKALITRKFQQGKLTMVGDLVDVVESAGVFGSTEAVNEPVNNPATTGGETFAAAQQRKESALANLRELEHRQKLGELVDLAEMERAWATAGQTFRDAALSLPERIAPQLAALTDPRQVRDLLRTEIRTILGNLPDQIRNADSDQQAA